MEALSRLLARWGAVAACLAGVSYGAWGYLDNPDASGFVIGVVVPALSVTTPALFLGGLVGLYYGHGREGSLLQRTGLLVGLVGALLGLFDQLDWWESDQWIPLYAALTAAGLGIFVGFYYLQGRGGSHPRWTGLLVCIIGTVLGAFDGFDWWELEWLILLFVGLMVVGVGMIVEDASQLLGFLVLVSGTIGWVSLLTDPAFSAVLMPTRPVHVVFAALFCLSWVAWGGVLFRSTP